MRSIHGHRIFQFIVVCILIVHAGLLSITTRRISVLPKMAPLPLKVMLSHRTSDLLQKSRQIVQSEDSATQESPSTESFLSDRDRKFERQTRSHSVDVFKQAGQGDSQVTQKSHRRSVQTKPVSHKAIKLSDIGVGPEIPQESTGRSPASMSTKGLKNGTPLSEGLSATNDYVEDIALGDFTRLNTVEYKYYGFYHRIRQKLEQFWGRSIQEKADQLFRSGRRLPASENLTTSLEITLNEKGEIIGVKILGASGVKELDDAAIESFNQAGPFPNPPKELLVNGRAVIQWGFVVKS